MREQPSLTLEGNLQGGSETINGSPTSLADPAKVPKLVTEVSAIPEQHLLNKLLSPTHEMHEAPSSWLDVDQRFSKKPSGKPSSGAGARGRGERKLVSSVSEDETEEPSAEFQAFIKNVKYMGVPFQLPMKRQGLGHQKPSFALPPIKEDYFEKTFDPAKFEFGQGKKTGPKNPSPAMILKKKNEEAKNKAQAKFIGTEKSVLLKVLKSTNHQSKDQGFCEEEEGDKEEEEGKKEETEVVSDRLGRSSVLSSLMEFSKMARKPNQESTASPAKQQEPPAHLKPSPPQKKAGIEEGAIPGTTHQPVPPESAPTLAQDRPPAPSFAAVKFPDFLEKLLSPEAADERNSVADQRDSVVAGSLPPSVDQGDLVPTPQPGSPQVAPPQPIPPAMYPKVSA